MAGAVVVWLGGVVDTVGTWSGFLVVGVAVWRRWDALGGGSGHHAGKMAGGGHGDAYTNK